MRPETILFDASILSTRTRDTGIGRYVVELGRALGQSDTGDVRVRYLVGAGLRHAIVDDAGEAIKIAALRDGVDVRHSNFALVMAELHVDVQLTLIPQQRGVRQMGPPRDKLTAGIRPRP